MLSSADLGNKRSPNGNMSMTRHTLKANRLSDAAGAIWFRGQATRRPLALDFAQVRGRHETTARKAVSSPATIAAPFRPGDLSRWGM